MITNKSVNDAIAMSLTFIDGKLLNTEKNLIKVVVKDRLSWAIDVGLLTLPEQLPNVIEKTFEHGWIF